MKYKSRSCKSSITLNTTSVDAHCKLALNYPRPIQTINNLQFQVSRFGVYINGVAAQQPGTISGGGGQQFLRVFGTEIVK